MTSRRFFSDYYDSVGQRGLFSTVRDDGMADSARRLYLARLRFDTLLSERLILTDSQLLDGRFFLGDDPKVLMDSMATMVSRKVPLEVRAREGDLEQALVGFVRSAGASTLKAFSFSAINSGEERKEVAARLAQCPTDKVGNLAELVRLLRDIGVAPENVEALEAGWRRWVELARSGGVTVVQWRSRDHDKFREARDRGLGRLQLGLERGPYSVAERAALLALVGDFKADQDENGAQVTRSHLDMKHRAFIQAYPSPKMIRAADRVRDVYDSSYHASFAEQHECDVHEVGEGNSLVGPAPVSDDFHNSVGEFDDLPPSIIQLLGRMESDEYKDLVLPRASSLREWWQNGNKKALRGALEHVLSQAAIFEKEDPALARWVNQVWPYVVKGIGGSSAAVVGVALAQAGGDVVSAGAAGAMTRAVVEAVIPARLRFLSAEGKAIQRVMDVAVERRLREKGH